MVGLNLIPIDLLLRLRCTPRCEIEFGVALFHVAECSRIPEGMLGRRKSE
jgi:hypothetical protein